MNGSRRAAALACAVLATAACTGKYTLRNGYHAPPSRPASASVPRVSLVAPPDYPDSLSWGLVVCNSKLTVGRAYLEAVEATLNSIYGTVSRVGSLAEAKDADYAVEVAALPREYSLRFVDPATGRVVAHFARPGEKRLNYVTSRGSNGFGNAVTLLLFPLSLPMCAPIIGAATVQAGQTLESHSATALEGLARDIASDPRVMLAPKDRLRLEELEERGDRALRAGEAREALPLFVEAAALAKGLGARARGLATKAARAAGDGGAPPVPEEAKRLMARGQAYFKQAASVADYRHAIVEMERALALAPWWGLGHFNAGLAHEGAGNWSEAADHFTAYLAASPGARDSAEVRGKLAELEIHAERGDKPAGAR